MKSNIVDIETIIVHKTQNAVLVKYAEDAEPIWLPLSQVEVDGEVGAAGTITLPEWLAMEKALI